MVFFLPDTRFSADQALKHKYFQEFLKKEFLTDNLLKEEEYKSSAHFHIESKSPINSKKEIDVDEE